VYTPQSAFSDSVYHIYHSFLKIIAESCTSLLAKGFIFILAPSKSAKTKNQVSFREELMEWVRAPFATSCSEARYADRHLHPAELFIT
jgi:hypothetical protein